MNELEKFKQEIESKIKELKNNKSSTVVEGKEMEYENILLGYYKILNSLISRP